MPTPLNFDQAAAWAESILNDLTLAEKCAMIGGTDVFYIKGLERLGLKPVLCSDATAGVVLRERFFDVTYQNAVPKSVAFPAPIMLAATWNPDLAEAYAQAIGEECNANGIGILLGPGFNLYRISQCGRNFEYFGEDPFLISRMVERYVKGVQSTGTIATLKHFVANNTDYFRRKSNSIVDARTLHEIYLPAFKAGIDAGAMAVMTSYNLVNGEWTGQSEAIIHDLLRDQLGFKWLVMSDWWSVFDGEKVVTSGQDLEMPARLATLDIQTKIEQGILPVHHLNRMVKSILTTLKAMHLFDRSPRPELLQNYPQHESVALQTAQEGTVLLRNENAILPIKPSESSILLLGPYIHKKAVGGGSSEVKGYQQISLYDALKQTFGDRVEYQASPTDQQIKNAGCIILATGIQEAESWDRSFALELGEELYVKRVLKANPNVIVLMNAGSAVRMTDWYQQAAAIVYCFYNGQNGHLALVDILTGKINPSGKLPFTIEREFSDGPGADYVPVGEALYFGENNEWEKARSIYDVQYSEGVLVGYRWYDTQNKAPLYPFGFGLSYTQFEYSDLNLSQDLNAAGPQVTVRFKLSNAGTRAGHEVVQIYVSDLDASVVRPLKELKGFQKIFMTPGEVRDIEFLLDASAFSFWCEQTGNWTWEPGAFNLLVGNSSRHLLLQQTIQF